MKKILFLFCIFMMFSVNSYAQTEIAFWENNIYVEGCLSKASDGMSSVYVLLEKDGNLEYINISSNRRKTYNENNWRNNK